MSDLSPDKPSALLAVPMPSRIRALPRNRVGYPIPFFVATVDGERDFRVADPVAYWACVRDRLCWICGQRRRVKEASFVIGPMCVVNRITAEPPCHIDCAEYAAKACPFLARPNMVRRTSGLPEHTEFGGVAIKRNPGVAVVYVTNDWHLFQPPGGGFNSRLFDLGDPVHVGWWTYGRPATRAEAQEAIASGLPLLEAECKDDEDMGVLAKQVKRAKKYLPDQPEDNEP